MVTTPFMCNLGAEFVLGLGKEIGMTTDVASFLKLTIRKDARLSPEVIRSLGELGWKRVHGSYDYVYRWDVDWKKNGKSFPQYSEEVKGMVDLVLESHDIRYVFKTFRSASGPEA